MKDRLRTLRFTERSNRVRSSGISPFVGVAQWVSTRSASGGKAERRKSEKAKRRKVGGIDQDHGENSNKRTNIQKGLGAPG